MKNMTKTFLLLITIPFLFMGCQYNPLATIPARKQETQKITLGSVQSQVKNGVSSADVINALGSPNIVTTNSDNTETWVYDKILSETEVTSGSFGAVKTQTSKTLLVTIKFNKQNKVEDVKYRQTSY